MKFGLIGVGAIGGIRAAALARSKSCSLTAVYDVDETRARSVAPSAPFYASVEALIDSPDVRLDRPGGRKSVERRFYPGSIVREKLRGWQSTAIQTFLEEFDDFAAASAGQQGSGRIALATHGLRAVQIAHAVYNSSRTGNRVSLDPLPEASTR